MAWSDIFLPSSAQTAREQEANYALQQAEYERRLQERNAANTPPPSVWTYTPLENQNAAAWEGFKEGAAEGWGNVTGAIKNPFGAIPPAWIIIGGIGAFLYFGGGEWLKKQLTK